MMPELNDYHKDQIEKKRVFMTYMKAHPMFLEECLNQYKRLREQRIARESKYCNY